MRDAFGVAHVNGKTEADVAYGAGWVTAADRGLLLQLIRGPARVAALDVPGLDPLELALTGKSFVPSPEAEAFLANQLDAVRSQRTVGPKILALVNAYAAGINGVLPVEGHPDDADSRRTTLSHRLRSSRPASGRTADRRRGTRCSSMRSRSGSARRMRGACSRICVSRTIPKRP